MFYYRRIFGIRQEVSGAGRANFTFSPEERTQFARFAKRSNVYDIISKSVAPAIYGGDDIKKAGNEPDVDLLLWLVFLTPSLTITFLPLVACLLFGGSRKQLPDGMRLRGDINILMLGDPGTAKSQMLKFVEKVSPIGVYTSGKGSSAAGLTASVIRDKSTKEFYLEGGAMVVADGGVVYDERE